MDAELIRKAAVAEGMVALREAAVRKMLSGKTTFDEIIKVVGEKTKGVRVSGEGKRRETFIISGPLSLFHGKFKFHSFHS